MNKKLNAKEVEKMIREFIEDPDFYVWVAPADLYEEYRDIFDKYIQENKIRVSKAEINGEEYVSVTEYSPEEYLELAYFGD